MYTLATAAQMKELDRVAIEERDIPSLDLMEAAATAVAEKAAELLRKKGCHILNRASSLLVMKTGGQELTAEEQTEIEQMRELVENQKDTRIAVFCGPGNNGGDGVAAARKAFLESRSLFSVDMLRTGAVIPAILITGINSGLKGFVEAQVSENVYDTATGRFLLIPQGSRLLGTYNNGVVYGQRRLLVAWNRITFPDGKIVDLGSMPGTDFAGQAGFKDQVDNHFLRLFGSALLMSAITAGINLSQQGFMGMGNMYGYGGGRMYGMNSSSVLSQSLGQGMGEAMQQLFQKNLNIAPTLKVRPGYLLNIMVSKDLSFSKPYRNFDY